MVEEFRKYSNLCNRCLMLETIFRSLGVITLLRKISVAQIFRIENTHSRFYIPNFIILGFSQVATSCFKRASSASKRAEFTIWIN